MGYYTDFKLTVDNTNSYELLDVLSSISEYDWYTSPSKPQCSSFTLCDVKWYDSKAHMLKISKHYPDNLFELEGDGEDSGDIWKAYFKNGKSYKSMALVTHPVFNADLLK